MNLNLFMHSHLCCAWFSLQLNSFVIYNSVRSGSKSRWLVVSVSVIYFYCPVLISLPCAQQATKPSLVPISKTSSVLSIHTCATAASFRDCLFILTDLFVYLQAVRRLYYKHLSTRLSSGSSSSSSNSSRSWTTFLVDCAFSCCFNSDELRLERCTMSVLWLTVWNVQPT